MLLGYYMAGEVAYWSSMSVRLRQWTSKNIDE